MAQKDLKLLWGSNSKMSGTSKPEIVDGKAYFAIVDGSTKYPDTTAPENEAFIYFDKDNTRYNVIAKRAIFDALGNKINSTYATDIESSGNTMSLFSADGGTAIDTAKIINSLAVGWTTSSDPTTAGPRVRITVNGQNSSYYAIPVAASDAAGVVTTGAQTFTGAKTFSGIAKFTNSTASSSKTTGAVVITGGLGVGGNIFGGAAISAATTLTAGTSATIGTTLTTGGDASIGGDLTVVGKDIFFGNTTGKIITLNANADGNNFFVKNLNNPLSFVINGIGGDGKGATTLELRRGEADAWEFRHADLGNFYLNNNGETILKLEKDTGNTTIKGKTTVQHLDIGHASDQVTYLSLNRAGFNYIRTPNEGGVVAFVVNGQTPGEATADLVIVDGQVSPGTTNATSLGSSSKDWSDTHSRGLTSADTLIVRSAASKTLTFAQGTVQVGQFDSAGSLKIVNNIYPATNDTKTLGTSSVYWNHVYSTNFTGTTFTGTSFTGNAASATKVYVTNTTPTTSTSYRLTYASGTTSSNQDLQYNDDLTYTDTGTTSALKIGCASHVGQFILSDGSSNTVTFTPTALEANRTITVPDAGGTMMTSSNYSVWASPNTHKHNVTISHTPAGTISKPTFTGTANLETSANIGTVSVGSSGHTHTYVKVTSVNAPTPNYTNTATNGPSGTASFYAYSSTSKPSLSASIANKCLTVTFTSPTTQGYTVSSSTHTHTYAKTTSITAPTLNTSTVASGTPSATTTVPSNGHEHTYTPAGTISTPTFTGTNYSTTYTTTAQI